MLLIVHGLRPFKRDSVPLIKYPKSLCLLFIEVEGRTLVPIRKYRLPFLALLINFLEKKYLTNQFSKTSDKSKKRLFSRVQAEGYEFYSEIDM